MLKNRNKKCEKLGKKIDENYVHNLLFADDQMIPAEDRYNIIHMIRRLAEEY